MKGISSIFSSLIVTVITLSIAVPLLIYFGSLYSNNDIIISQNFNKINEALETDLSVIKIGNYANSIYLYNYGKTEIYITSIIINQSIYKVNFSLKPGQIISLSAMLKTNLYIGNSTIIIKANDNYYYFT